MILLVMLLMYMFSTLQGRCFSSCCCCFKFFAQHKGCVQLCQPKCSLLKLNAVWPLVVVCCVAVLSCQCSQAGKHKSGQEAKLANCNKKSNIFLRVVSVFCEGGYKFILYLSLSCCLGFLRRNKFVFKKCSKKGFCFWATKNMLKN